MSSPVPTAGPVPEPGAPSRQRLILAGILLVTIFVAYFDRVNVSILMADPTFLAAMGIKGQPVKIGLLMTTFLATYGLANIVLSPLGDYFGPRKAMCISIALWGLSMIVGGLAGSFAVMIAARIMLGVGEGMHYPMQSIFVKKWFPPRERGKANAVWLTGQSLAPAAAMPFFAWIVAAAGWHSSFFACAVVGLVPLYLLWFHTADSPREHKLVNALELKHIEDGLAEENKGLSAAAQTSFWAGARLFVLDYRFWILVLWTCCMSAIYWGLFSWLPSYLKTARGFSWSVMGALSSLPFLLGIVAKLAGGYLSDRFDRRAVFCSIAMLGAAIGIYFGATASNNYTAALLIALGMGVLSFGTPAAWSLMQRFASGRSISTAAGLMNGIAIGFGAAAPLAIGYFISLTGGYTGGLYVLVTMAVVGLLASLVLTVQKY